MNSPQSNAMQRSAAWPRCDRTGAWQALKNHYDRHGRGFDLRDAFARHADRFEVAGRARRRRSTPTCRRTCSTPATLQLPARPRTRVRRRRRGATRMLRRRGRSTSPKAARCCTARCARRAGRARSATTSIGVLDAMLAYARNGARHRGAAASGTSSTSASAAATSGRRWSVPALDAFVHPGLSFHFVSQRRRPRHRAGAAPAQARRDAVHHRQQDLHDAGDDGQRACREGLVRRQRRHRHRAGTSSRRRPTSRPPPSSASRTTFGFWDWVGGRYSLWSAIGLPIALAIGADNFRALLAGAHAMDRALRRGAGWRRTCRCCSGCSTSGIATSTASRAAAWRPITRGSKRLPAYLQQLEMESNGKRVDLRRRAAALRAPARWCGASRAPTASMPTSRCCTRAPT